MFVSEFVPDQGQHTLPKTSQILVEFCCKKTPHLSVPSGTWWFIPVSKWIITPVISELTLLSPVVTRGITYLLSGGEPPSNGSWQWKIPQFVRWFSRDRNLHLCLSGPQLYRGFAMGCWKHLRAILMRKNAVDGTRDLTRKIRETRCWINVDGTQTWGSKKTCVWTKCSRTKCCGRGFFEPSGSWCSPDDDLMVHLGFLHNHNLGLNRLVQTSTNQMVASSYPMKSYGVLHTTLEISMNSPWIVSCLSTLSPFISKKNILGIPMA